MWVTFLPGKSLIPHILSLLQCFFLYRLFQFNDVQRAEDQTKREKHQHRATWKVAATTEEHNRNHPSRGLNSLKSVCCNKPSNNSCCVPQKNQQGHKQVSIYSNKISLIGFHWDSSQSRIPMSKLRPFRNKFSLTLFNEDFVMCITVIMGSSK